MAGTYSAKGAYVYQDDWRAEVYVTVVDTNATTCTVTVRGEWDSIYGSSSYCTGSITKNSSGGTDTGISLSITAGGHGTIATRTFTVARGSSQKSITCKAVVVGGGSTYSGVSSTASVSVTIPAIAYSAPNPPTGCTQTRDSDSKATVAWTNGSTTTEKPRSAVLVERMDGDGAWTQIASASADATSYADNSISANHRYAYRVRSQGAGGYSGYSTADGYIFTTPAAPSSVVLSKTAQTVIEVDVDGAAPYAEGYRVELTYDGGGTWQTVEASTSLPISVNVEGGTVQFRVASLNGSLQSAWTLSEPIVTICPPLAPTITSRPNNPTAMGASCSVAWLPNHPDGTAQTAAQVKLTRPSGTSSTYDLTAEQEWTFSPELTGTYSVQVRTKGLDPDWGAWSDSVSWGVYEPPVVVVTSPATDGAEVVALPLAVSWTVTDATGVSAQRVTIADENGTTVYNQTQTADVRSLSLTDSDVALQNGLGYTTTVRVMGGSGLVTTVQRTFAVDWLAPAVPSLTITEGEGAAAMITVDSQSTEYPAAESLDVDSAILTSLHIYGESVQDGTPTPSSPAPIYSVEGRNLLDRSTEESGYITSTGATATSASWLRSGFIPVTAGVTYTFQPNSTGGDSSYWCWYDASENFIPPAVASGARTATAPSGAVYARVSYRVTSYDVQLEIGSTATDYIPYGTIALADGTRTYPIDLQGNALRSLPDGTRDELDVAGGSAVLTKRVGSFVIDSAAYNIYTVNGHKCIAIGPRGISSALGNIVMCDRAVVKTTVAELTVGTMYKNSGSVLLVADKDSTLEDILAMYGGTTVYYPLATPQTIDLGSMEPPYVDGTVYVDAQATPTISATSRPASEAGTPETESVTVQRVNADGSVWTVASNLPLGGTCIDPLPPLGVGARYLATASAQSGATASEAFSATIGGREWVLNFGSAAQEHVETIYNPEGSDSLESGGDKLHFAGRRYGVWYATDDLDMPGSWSFDTVSFDASDRLYAHVAAHGTAWLRDPFGHRILAHVKPSRSYGMGRIVSLDVAWDAVEFKEAWDG